MRVGCLRGGHNHTVLGGGSGCQQSQASATDDASNDAGDDRHDQERDAPVVPVQHGCGRLKNKVTKN